MSIIAESHSQQPVAAIRPEPRAMTVLDLMVLVTGFALMIPVLSIGMGGTARTALETVDRGDWAGQSASTLLGLPFLMLSSALSFVVLERQYVYHRPARPAEWISLISFTMVITAVVLRPYFGGPEIATGAEGPSVMLGFCLIVLAGGLVALAYARPWLPPWSLTAAILGLVALWIVGPVTIFAAHSFQIWSHVAPSNTPWLADQVWLFLIRVPTILLFGIPATATLLQFRRGQRPWTWIEWTCASSMLIWYVAGSLEWYWPNGGVTYFTPKRLMEPVWLIATLAVSWILIRVWRLLAPRWKATAR